MIELKLTEEETMYLLSLVSNFVKACEKSFDKNFGEGHYRKAVEAREASEICKSIECKILKEVKFR